MRRLRKTCLVTPPLDSSSFQFGRFIAAQSPQAPQHAQGTSGAKAQAAEKKQPDYSQEAYVIEVIGVTNDMQFSASRHVHTFGEKFQVLGAGRGC
jgi:hypothetical protein